jgi:hypothetical protein
MADGVAVRRLALIAGLALAVTAQAAGGPYFRRFVRNEVRAAPDPGYFFSLLASDPATECNGAALVSAEGTSVTHTNATTTRYCLGVATNPQLTARAANSPRVSNLGVLVETSRTNPVIRNTALDDAAWTATNVTVTADAADDAAGGQAAETLETTAAGGYIESTAFVPGVTSATVSLWAGQWVEGDDFSIVVRDTTAGADRATCTQAANAEVLTRVACNATGLTGANNHVVRIYPGGTAGEGGIIAWGVQFESFSNFLTSTIPTAAAAVTRAVDVYTWSNPTDISAAGCISATVTFGTSTSITVGGSVVSNGTEQMLGTFSSTAVRINDGTNSVTATVPNLAGRTVNLRSYWSGSTMGLVADGVAASGTFDGSFSSTSVMHIGRTTTGTGYCNCWVDNIKVGSHPESCL